MGDVLLERREEVIENGREAAAAAATRQLEFLRDPNATIPVRRVMRAAIDMAAERVMRSGQVFEDTESAQRAILRDAARIVRGEPDAVQTRVVGMLGFLERAAGSLPSPEHYESAAAFLAAASREGAGRLVASRR